MGEHDQEATVAVPAAALDALMRAWETLRAADLNTNPATWQRARHFWRIAAMDFCAAILPTWQPQPSPEEKP